MKNTLTQNLLIVLTLFCSYLPMKAQQLTFEDPFVSMIVRGRFSGINPIYTMPLMTGTSTGYLKAAITTGDANVTALNYSASSANSYYIISSRNPAILEKGRSFNLILNGTDNLKKHCAYISADWNRDGIFETVLPRVGSIGSLNQNVVNIAQQITIPENALTGKTRIRVRYSDAQSDCPGPNEAVVNGLVYDFVVYVVEKTERTDCAVSVFSQTEAWGNAIIETVPNEHGRYELNSTLTVRAIPAENASFIGWFINNEKVSAAESYSFVVTESVSLMAHFYMASVEPVLETPVISTEEQPIWYQIKNAHTADTRKDRYIVYDQSPSSEFTTNLRAEKNAAITNAWLWRLQQDGSFVKLIHKESGLELTGNGSGDLSMSSQGALFEVSPSGNANGSFSIKYNGDITKLVNAADQSWKIVFYNAGIGTGSGWYFYRVDIPNSIEKTMDDLVRVTVLQGCISLRNLDTAYDGRIFDQNGRLCMMFSTNTESIDLNWERRNGIYILILTDAAGRTYSFKVSC